jgi:hypothetical protein
MTPRNRSMEELAMPISIKGYISLVSATPSAARTQARLTAPQAGGVTRE